MGPADLAESANKTAEAHGATVRLLVGAELLDNGFPAVHAVGRAAAPERAPRLIDLTWGEPSHPKVTLVGKGVCFDSGGLDLKSAAHMKLMKKDMGGGAHVLGVASMIMDAKLPVRLRVIIPAVENSVSGSALRPLDVVPTRKGTTIEIGNTDAEGRVILADALTEASGDAPELLVDFATLTGAARIALGAELPALYSSDDETAAALLVHGERESDPLWRMPLYKPLSEAHRRKSRRHHQLCRHSTRRFDHCRTVSSGVRRARHPLGPHRRHGLEHELSSGTPRGRRSDGNARGLRPD